MDLNEFLETIVEFDKNKPWGIVVSQVVFNSFRNYCIDYLDEPKEKLFESLYELTIDYIDDNFKEYIDEIFQVEHFEQFDARDLCLEFFKKFTKYLDSLNSGDLSNEEKITDFLDYNIFKYFEIILSDNDDFWFFPCNYEDYLRVDLYNILRLKLIKQTPQISGELLNTSIEQINNPLIKSVSRAIVKKRHKLTKKKLSFKVNLKTRKNLHK